MTADFASLRVSTKADISHTAAISITIRVASRHQLRMKPRFQRVATHRKCGFMAFGTRASGSGT